MTTKRSGGIVACTLLLLLPALVRAQMQEGMGMPGALRPMASGTSWAPRSSPMGGLHFAAGAWSLMLHGFANADYTSESGPRGDRKLFSTNMLMLSAMRAAGPGTLQLRAMMSAEPAMGPRGYPLLLQTGESADGLYPLVDRQHPHDAFMELSATWAVLLPQEVEAYVYVAPVGEPALGPTAFMHRESGRDIPVAPISHHYMDATHITYGVITAGIVSRSRVKLEASLFNGLEPDQHHWGLETPRLNSWALRLGVDASPNLTLQGSAAKLKSPERMHPGIDQVKLTLSATWNRPLRDGNWQSTLVYGRNRSERTLIPVPVARATFPAPILAHYLALASFTGLPEDSLTLVFPGRIQSAYLLESSLRQGATTMFLRIERALKDEMFPPTDLRHSTIYPVGAIVAGGIRDVLRGRRLRFGVGVIGSVDILPATLRAVYHGNPTSGQIFTRIALY